MVTPEEFARVQTIIAGRYGSVPHQKDRPEFPLRGLVRCDQCRYPLTATFSGGRSRRYPYYLCHQPECPRRGKSTGADEVHHEFTDFLTEIAPRATLMQTVANRIVRAATKDQEASLARRRSCRKRLGEIDGQMNELIRMRAQTLITDGEFLAQKQQLTVQRISLEDHEKRRETPEQIKTDLGRIAAPLLALKATWHSLKPPFRRRFERLILPGGYAIKNIRTADLGLLFSFFRASGGEMSHEVPLGGARSNPESLDILQEIKAFRDVLDGVEEGKRPPKRRFECSHRAKLRMTKSNRESPTLIEP